MSDELEDVVHGTLAEFLQTLSERDDLPDDVRDEAHHWLLEVTDEDDDSDPDGEADEGQVEGDETS